MNRLLLTLLALNVVPIAQAHVVPRGQHDRAIVVHLQPAEEDDQILVRVDYRLEVDETTVFLTDLASFKDQIDLDDFKKSPLTTYRRYGAIYAPSIGKNLLLSVNGQRVPLSCVAIEPTLHDEKGAALGHLRVDFTFFTWLKAEARNVLQFRDLTWQEQTGETRLYFRDDRGLDVLELTAPSEKLLNTPALERTPEQDEQMVKLDVVFRLPSAATPPAVVSTPSPPVSARKPADDDHDSGLWKLVISEDHAFWMVMVLAFVAGAAHALTPGHGKTLVAAYLVGERGTILHAVVLGVVTTLTHTGAVLVFAIVYAFMPASMQKTFASSLGLGMGLVIVLMGFYLFLQRASNRADHIHIGGGDHHHHHEPPPPGVGWWNLVLLGITGGIVPCWDAVVLLLWTIGSDRQWIAVPAIVSFSLGLASVLVVIGIVVVKARRLAGKKWGEGRWTKWLSLASAVAVMGLGFWLCHEAVHSMPP